MTLSVSIRHAGTTHNLSLDPSLPARVFKESIYEVTSVPVDRMKVLVKGGVLKDDEKEWARVKPKDGMVFTVIGAKESESLPKPPEKKIVFLEGTP